MFIKSFEVIIRVSYLEEDCLECSIRDSFLLAEVKSLSNNFFSYDLKGVGSNKLLSVAKKLKSGFDGKGS